MPSPGGDGRLTDLGAPSPGAANNSEIYDLNGAGVGAGVSETGLVDPVLDFPAQHATVFVHGRLIDLGRSAVTPLTMPLLAHGVRYRSGNAPTPTVCRPKLLEIGVTMDRLVRPG